MLYYCYVVIIIITCIGHTLDVCTVARHAHEQNVCKNKGGENMVQRDYLIKYSYNTQLSHCLLNYSLSKKIPLRRNIFENFCNYRKMLVAIYECDT